MYYHIETQTKLQSINDIRKLHPNVSFPREISEQIANDFSVYRVEEVYPVVADNQVLVKSENVVVSIPDAEGADPDASIHCYINHSVRDKTPEELAQESNDALKAITVAVQTMLDSAAIEKGYDSILSACSYAAHTNPFQTEGQLAVEWRGNVWAKCYEILAEVEAGTRSAPTIDELLIELPSITW